MAPLITRIKEHKAQMEKRLESLRKINESRDTLQAKVAELQVQAKNLSVQMNDLNGLMQTLSSPLDAEQPSQASQVA